ncbi:MAG: hypothetical protein KGI50_05915 [Patescibacteria group bacterium]|nr:hypothetical protein [Patescibacteria group bacterium]MDE2438812.1 hypothetical protein [Patescibacteria group bacterium]
MSQKLINVLFGTAILTLSVLTGYEIGSLNHEIKQLQERVDSYEKDLNISVDKIRIASDKSTHNAKRLDTIADILSGIKPKNFDPEIHALGLKVQAAEDQVTAFAEAVKFVDGKLQAHTEWLRRLEEKGNVTFKPIPMPMDDVPNHKKKKSTK